MNSRRRLAKFKRRKDTAKTSTQFLKWSLRYHALFYRLNPSPKLWV